MAMSERQDAIANEIIHRLIDPDMMENGSLEGSILILGKVVACVMAEAIHPKYDTDALDSLFAHIRQGVSGIRKVEAIERFVRSPAAGRA